jgi:GTP1/Obg family GTP-binding protein
MSIKMPNDIDILAVEIENNYTIAETLSPKIVQSFSKCSLEIIKLLTSKNIITNNLNLDIANEINSYEDLKEFYKEESFEKDLY